MTIYNCFYAYILERNIQVILMIVSKLSKEIETGELESRHEWLTDSLCTLVLTNKSSAKNKAKSKSFLKAKDYHLHMGMRVWDGHMTTILGQVCSDPCLTELMSHDRIKFKGIWILPSFHFTLPPVDLSLSIETSIPGEVCSWKILKLETNRDIKKFNQYHSNI